MAKEVAFLVLEDFVFSLPSFRHPSCLKWGSVPQLWLVAYMAAGGRRRRIAASGGGRRFAAAGGRILHLKSAVFSVLVQLKTPVPYVSIRLASFMFHRRRRRNIEWFVN